MPVIFEYVPRNTFVHRLNTFSRATLILALLYIVSIYWDPLYLGIIAAIAAALYLISRTPKKWMLIPFPFAAYRFIEALILGFALADPKYFKVIPLEQAGKVVFQLGPFPLIYGGLVWALAYIFRIVIVGALTFTFIYSTSINDLVRTLAYLRIPQKLIYVITIAFRFVPELFRNLRLISLAQSLRGWELKTRNPIKLFKMSAPIVMPFTTNIVGYVDKISLTLEVRSFGVGKGKYKREVKFTLVDWAIIIASIAGCVLATYLMLAYNIGLI
ncbi:MAG: energy-coupling factor transporter transmembrane component T [Candidatus Bathyarchaeia archaeon]